MTARRKAKKKERSAKKKKKVKHLTPVEVMFTFGAMGLP
jgi:hypothetical protein